MPNRLGASHRNVADQFSWRNALFLLYVIVILSCFIIFGTAQAHGDETHPQSGSLDQESAVDLSPIVTQEQKIKTNRLTNFQPRRSHQNQKGSNENNARRINLEPKQEDQQPSTDCLTKRNEILKRHGNPKPGLRSPSPASPPPPPPPQGSQLPAYQRLKPKHDAYVAQSNETILNLSEVGEHIPECNDEGAYKPVQCHVKIGYCWCVNKYGNAIKNSAKLVPERPYCDRVMYDSESTDFLVVAGTTTQRIKKYLKPTTSLAETTTPNGNINFEAESTTEFAIESGQQQVGNESGGGAKNEPILPLIPNDCKNSQANAKERASKLINDSIWVPACDLGNDRLYALRQCHKSKVCWCVDQVTGLPLRTKDPITDKSSGNCTEIKEIVEMASSLTAASSSKPQAAFYHGSSEFCDNYRRVEFVISLNNQFRQQISDIIRQTPASSLPPGLTTVNPHTMSESQVSRWKFVLMDKDLDGQLSDREWSKFKNNFKLVDKNDEIEHPFKEKSLYSSSGPLMILRSERKCWRDFLDFCGSGDLLNNESVSSTKWLHCTDVPRKLDKESTEERALSLAFSENTYANSREAAIIRSKKKNPFLGILKPD